MKTRILFLLCAIASICIVRSVQARKTIQTDLALMNIEYLTRDESDETKVKRCIKNLWEDDKSAAYFYKCSERTSASTFYTCPSSPTNGHDGDQYTYYCINEK